MKENDEWKDKIITPRIGVAGVVIHNTWSAGKKILMIRRKFPPHGIAFPGGFQEVGETVAQTAVREVKEETNIDARPLGIMRVSSGPHTDPRFHVTAIYVLMKPISFSISAGDDATEAFWLEQGDYKHDHEMSTITKYILEDLKSEVKLISLG